MLWISALITHSVWTSGLYTITEGLYPMLWIKIYSLQCVKALCCQAYQWNLIALSTLDAIDLIIWSLENDLFSTVCIYSKGSLSLLHAHLKYVGNCHYNSLLIDIITNVSSWIKYTENGKCRIWHTTNQMWPLLPSSIKKISILNTRFLSTQCIFYKRYRNTFE